MFEWCHGEDLGYTEDELRMFGNLMGIWSMMVGYSSATLGSQPQCHYKFWCGFSYYFLILMDINDMIGY